MRSPAAVGGRAERLAREFLERQGLVTLAVNYRCPGGELDLVMANGTELVIVEVRYRARREPVDPALTVTASKRRRLLRATVHFLQHHARYCDYTLRFDIIGLCGTASAPDIRWLRNAFNGEELA